MPRHIGSQTHTKRNVTSDPLHAVAVGRCIISVEEAIEVERRSIMVEYQLVDDSYSFIVQTLDDGVVLYTPPLYT